MSGERVGIEWEWVGSEWGESDERVGSEWEWVGSEC